MYENFANSIKTDNYIKLSVYNIYLFLYKYQDVHFCIDF